MVRALHWGDKNRTPRPHISEAQRSLVSSTHFWWRSQTYGPSSYPLREHYPLHAASVKNVASAVRVCTRHTVVSNSLLNTGKVKGLLGMHVCVLRGGGVTHPAAITL